MTFTLHKNDLPDTVSFGDSVAVDTETRGLVLKRDPLCLVQISGGDGHAHIVQLNRETYDAPNLKKVLSNPNVTKIFHFGRFDLAVIKLYLGVECRPVYCTRTASKLVRTYTDRHGLRDVCREMLNIELNKFYQTSDWGAASLSDEQLSYAANDVLHLHALRAKFDELLIREGRKNLADRVFDFLPTRALLDLEGWANVDIFEH